MTWRLHWGKIPSGMGVQSPNNLVVDLKVNVLFPKNFGIVKTFF